MKHTRRKNKRPPASGKFKEPFHKRFGKKEDKPKATKPSRPDPVHVVGVVVKTRFGWGLQNTDRRDKTDYVIRKPAEAEQKAGDLVAAEILPSSKNKRREVRITHHLGNPDDPRNISLIAVHANGIPVPFTDRALREAGEARPVTIDKRTDLRAIPFVTIDGPDARDFDDAVFAEPDKNGGWHLVVAIADVAHYVRPGSALDTDAYERGNSTYFPDRIVPMLPETLSNDLCSLRPDEERACMAVHMWLDKEGELTRWKFVRGVIKSRARLTYEQVQAAYDGTTDKQTAPLLNTVIKPLYGAYRCLMQARLKRGTLELDLPERKVELNKDGTVRAIVTRERLDSHKLIEEFMIAANVAAAAQLEQKGGICLYRIHDKPAEMKLEALRDFLATLDISLMPAKQLYPHNLTHILELAAGGPHAEVVNEVMLRSQAQAVYSPANIGHFGLALAKYAHFTSPIRRYADLIVHRGLIRALRLGDDGLTDDAIERLEGIGDHISMTERRSVTAERDAVDRFTTLFLADKTGAVFTARISGVARFGLFARLDDSGADGIIPFHALPRDYYHHDETRHALVGQRSKRTYQLGQRVKVRLDNADRLTGSMSLSIVDDDDDKRPTPRNVKKRRSRRT